MKTASIIIEFEFYSQIVNNLFVCKKNSAIILEIVLEKNV